MYSFAKMLCVQMSRVFCRLLVQPQLSIFEQYSFISGGDHHYELKAKKYHIYVIDVFATIQGLSTICSLGLKDLTKEPICMAFKDTKCNRCPKTENIE